jgi:hypothetical protein
MIEGCHGARMHAGLCRELPDLRPAGETTNPAAPRIGFTPFMVSLSSSYHWLEPKPSLASPTMHKLGKFTGPRVAFGKRVGEWSIGPRQMSLGKSR